jgi:hypothetical protein
MMMMMMFQISSQFFSFPISLSRKINVSRCSSFLLLLSPSLSLSLSLDARLADEAGLEERERSLPFGNQKRKKKKERKKELSFVSFLGFQNPNYFSLSYSFFLEGERKKEEKLLKNSFSLSLSSSLSAAATTTTGHERGVIKEL